MRIGLRNKDLTKQVSRVAIKFFFYIYLLFFIVQAVGLVGIFLNLFHFSPLGYLNLGNSQTNSSKVNISSGPSDFTFSNLFRFIGFALTFFLALVFVIQLLSLNKKEYAAWCYLVFFLFFVVNWFVDYSDVIRRFSPDLYYSYFFTGELLGIIFAVLNCIFGGWLLIRFRKVFLLTSKF